MRAHDVGRRTARTVLADESVGGSASRQVLLERLREDPANVMGAVRGPERAHRRRIWRRSILPKRNSGGGLQARRCTGAELEWRRGKEGEDEPWGQFYRHGERRGRRGAVMPLGFESS